MPSSAETPRTRVISIRVPKQLLKVADTLVEAGFFKNRTEFTIAAYAELLDRIGAQVLAYLAAKKKVGEPTRENLADFIKTYMDYLAGVTSAELEKVPLEESFFMVVLSRLATLDKSDPERMEKIIEAFEIDLQHLKVEENKEKQAEADTGVIPNADRPGPTPGDENSSGGDHNGV